MSGPGTAAPDLAPEPGSDRERFPFDDFTYCLTLFSKCFSSFDHSTCSLSVSGLCLALEGVYLPLGAAFPNNPTRRRSFVWPPSPTPTGLSPSVASRSKEHGAGKAGRRLLCKLQLRRSPDFKFGLLPLRSPLLRQSLLVSFPPLIDMLKFSGYSRLIRGRTFSLLGSGGCPAGAFAPRCQRLGALCRRSSWFPATSRAPSPLWGFERRRLRFSGPSASAPRERGAEVDEQAPRPSRGSTFVATLGQACPPECRRAQCAFKDSMVRWILQFTSPIAFRCVLHRCQNQEIRRQRF